MSVEVIWRTVATGVFRAAVAGAMLSVIHAEGQLSHGFDFGVAATAPGYAAVDSSTLWSAGNGYGWLDTTGLQNRDRGVDDDLLRDFVIRITSSESSTFRVSGLIPDGKYRMTVTCGDADYGDHVMVVNVPGAGTLPTLSPGTSEYETLNATVDADASGVLDVTFSPGNNWAVNALTLEPATSNITPFIESVYILDSTWDPAVFTADPTSNLLNGFDGTGATGFSPTGLTSDDYLVLIEGEVDFWLTYQDANGAVIDPYTVGERQYSTPAFAHAAAALVVYAGRADLLEPAARAMDWASARLGAGAAADGHADFYAPMVANAYRLLEPLVDSSRAAAWASNLDYDPYAIYTGGWAVDFNWNMIASGGEALLQLWGLRSSDNPYVDDRWGGQGHHFASPYGIYLEGPMCYDIFPRVYLTDAIEQGYSGPFTAEMSEAMDRAALSSLFMQSPWGELPSGGRSAHHQWNEAEQCFIYEVYAGKAKAEGNLLLAAAYKRAAHLSLASMFRWVRPSGEMQIVKNWIDPSGRYAYESYSYHSQYNLMPMQILARAYEYAAASEDVAEGPAPADTGGFVFAVDRLDIPSRPHKIFANAGGTYVEINTFEDLSYDATGLIRVHQPGLPPQLGLTDSLVAGAGYNTPNPAPVTTGAGVAWLDDDGTTWRTLGEMTSSQATSIVLTPVSQSTTQVVFDVTYSGSLPNVTSITEHYVVAREGVELTTSVAGYSGALRYLWPVHTDDGATQSVIGINGDTVSVSKDGAAATFTALNAGSVLVDADEYSNHNGWARLGIAEYPAGGAITLLISHQEPDVHVLSKSPTGEIYDTTPVMEVVIEDQAETVDPSQVVLLVDGSPVPVHSRSKVGAETTVRGTVASPLMYGTHTAGVVAGPGSPTNEWVFSVAPLPPVPVGDITYVDASSGSSGNTMAWSGASWIPFNPPVNQSSTADDQWEEEEAGFGGYGNGPTQNWFESNREGDEDCPQLRTQIAGLDNRTYAVFAYFWVANGQGFRFGAALTNNPAGALPLYAVGSAHVTAADADAFADTVVVTSSDRTLYQVTLGVVTGTTVAVYVDDEAFGGYSSSCWYDGIGYALNVATAATDDVSVTVSNETLRIDWPETHVGWVLQSTTNLADGVWNDLEGSSGDHSWNRLKSSLPDAEFYRIRYPVE